jgi:predicted MPP superfamily phosphohydrolase
MLMLHLIWSLPGLYVSARTIAPLPWPLAVKLLAIALVLVGSQFHLWSRLSSGSVFAPEFARWLVIVFNWAFGALLLLAVFQIALDLGALLVSAVRWRMAAIPPGARYAIMGVAGALTAIGVRNASVVPPVKDVTIQIAGLPGEFDGYRIVQLTDLHISRLFPRAWAAATVARTNSLGADAILVTGDVIDGSVAMRRDDVAPLADLRAPDGVWLSPGNHEYFFGYRAWMDHLAGLGMRVLENAHTVVRRGDGALVFAGVTDLSARRAGQAAPDVAAALRGAPVGAPVILLDHQPSQARGAAAKGVALQLSGHTHGGLILGLDRLVARANNGFVSGRYEVGAMQLYVNNGTALWPGMAVRLGRPAELTRITLRRAPTRAR